MELICISDTYSEDFLKVFAKYDIKFPKEGEIVTMVGYEKLPRVNKTGLYVEPYTKQYISGEIFGIKGEKEVSFDSKRFTTLLGEPLTMEMLKENKEEQNYVQQKPLNKEQWN